MFLGLFFFIDYLWKHSAVPDILPDAVENQMWIMSQTHHSNRKMHDLQSHNCDTIAGKI